YQKDVAAVRPGGYLVYDGSWPLDAELMREDITFLPVPFGQMCIEAFEGDRTRTLLRNIVYTGTLSALLEIDMAILEEMLKEKFSKKKSLLDANFRAIEMGYEYARKQFSCPLPFHLKRMDATGSSIVIDGNTAAALGCVYAGATVGAWYPITPSTSLMEAFKEFCERFRVDAQTGEKQFAIIQAEDELAAAGMIIGAGWAGARAFTSTAGPGISLMEEFIGLAYYAEVPAVFFDIQRTGPSTGMPTRTQQGDLMATAYASHGDTKHLCLYPANPRECFYMASEAFDLAERFQTPVFVVSDLDIGMNDWVVPRLTWDDAHLPDRGKVLSAQALEQMTTKFARYLDVDGDGIAARTLPGVHPKGAFFTRGSGHDKYGTYTEDADEYQEVVDRLARKINGAASAVPAPEFHLQPGAEVGIVSIGGCHGAVLEATHRLKAQGITADYMRIRGFPFDTPVVDFLKRHRTVFVVEQNRDAQLRALLTLETGVLRDHMIPVLDYGGLPLTARRVVDAVVQHVHQGTVA
ncbi:MAG TPA: 2-oxoacid:acceptor oxidoreductase subunit alpha, partial [Vicinamibacterales bacterium]|nr:2-oxoacid:acceptor oxidoreductase subunit alpha [Vicinamibacterales bacterium]